MLVANHTAIQEQHQSKFCANANFFWKVGSGLNLIGMFRNRTLLSVFSIPRHFGLIFAFALRKV